MSHQQHTQNACYDMGNVGHSQLSNSNAFLKIAL
jgi:hypothetical protein